MPMNYLDSHYGDVGAINQLGGAMQNIAIGLPQLRMQQQRLMQQMALQRATEILRQAQVKEAGARAGLYTSQAGLADQKKQELMNQHQQGLDLSSNVGTYLNQQAMSQGPTLQAAAMQNAIPAITSMAEIAARSPRNIMTQGAQALQMNEPGFQKQLGLGGRPQMNVPGGSTMVDAISGLPMFQSPLEQRIGSMSPEDHFALQRMKDEAAMARIKARPGDPLKQKMAEVLGGGTSDQPTTASAKPGAPKPGTVYKGYRFKGGDPGQQANWEQVQ